MRKKISALFLALMMTSSQLLALDDFMRNTGKIYAVVVVLVIMFIGVFYYLFSIDRNLTKLENQIKKNGQDE